ncbi:PREDICTED: uncharacterized protein LOC105972205 [Erythranthe guttata]|uniref:uncharacterized protein LOC105972205 n=1 Tax=Erythranthe guttata TaxID=4155 RepID=UPI00064DE169|nr:PREDICTED: uncharacterized protein LOC105972205 [Erythranthe guttata]|eukprot:XP_012852596.1 PREDICTED: uncharacterized protein LOC105972205 [Erythranthe guttata]
MAGESTQKIEQEMLFDIPSNYQSPFPESSADIAEVDYETDENEESNGEETDDSDSTFSDGFEDSDFEYDDVLSLSKRHSSAKAKSSKYQIYKDDADESDFEFEVGLCFKTATDFREAVRKYSNKQGMPISFKKNCSDKVQAICACGWVIYASFISKIDNTFQVKSIKREHTCSRDPSSKHCTSIFLAKKYQHHLRSNPEWPAGSMQEIMQMENHTSLSIWKMYRAKKHATKLNQGTELGQYANLWQYCEEIFRTNPDTTIKIKCKKGFKAGCRPVIGLDDTHLKTSRGGVLLCAVGIDGNNSMYPIAYAMVLKENRKSWEWFVSLLIDDLEMRNSYGWTIISDKQKGLIRAIEDLLPHYEHRFCVRHMYNNFKQKHKGLQLKDCLWKAASTTRVVDFNREMEKLKACDRAAYDWGDYDEKNSFSKDKVKKSNGDICPSVQRTLENNKKKAYEYILEWNGHDKFEVKGWVGDQWTVDLTLKTCSCRKWDISGIPCVHATACIFYRRENTEDYVEHWYRKDTFLKAYSHMLNPLKGQKEWPDSTLNTLVPWYEKPKKAGRPLKHARRKESDESSQKQVTGKRNGPKYSCSKCGKLGHNKKGCKEASTNLSAGVSSQITKRQKLPVKINVEKSNFVVRGCESLPQESSSGTTTSLVATRIYRMESNRLVTQQSDNHSTVTRVYD